MCHWSWLREFLNNWNWSCSMSHWDWLCVFLNNLAWSCSISHWRHRHLRLHKTQQVEQHKTLGASIPPPWH